jgi:hypothetical protein
MTILLRMAAPRVDTLINIDIPKSVSHTHRLLVRYSEVQGSGRVDYLTS